MKYEIVYSESIGELKKDINGLAEAGYKLHTIYAIDHYHYAVMVKE